MTSFLLGWPGGSLEATLKLFGLLFVVYILVLWLSAIVWVYRDVRMRTDDQTSQLVAVLLVAVFNVPGLVVYLVIRPQTTITDAYERSLEAEAILHELQASASSCQNCQRPIEDDYWVCPHCKTVLREACRNCGRSVRTTWQTCPYCATDRVPPRPMPVPEVTSGTEPLLRPRRQTAASSESQAPRSTPTARTGVARSGTSETT